MRSLLPKFMPLPWFYIQLIIRVILITLNAGLVAYCYISRTGWFTFTNLSILLVLQVVLLIRFLNRTNRDLARFFSSIREEGASLVFQGTHSTRSGQRLTQALEQLNREWKRMQENHVISSQYFHTVFQHVGIGLISVFEDGKVEYMNRSARELLGSGPVAHIRELRRIDNELPEVLLSLKPGQNRLFRMMRQSEMLQLSLKTTTFIFRNNRIKLISLQNISPELEERELDSWQKLIRVLTHEIMNSVAPISSTIETINGFFTDPSTGRAKQLEQIDEKTISNTLQGLEIIEGRSKGLLEFVKHYRRLTLVSKPSFSVFRVEELVRHLTILLAEKMEAAGAHILVDIHPPELEIKADKKLIEQVMINLLNNAIEALEEEKPEQKVIRIRASLNQDQKVQIEVEDNGKGIPPELIDQIFIPFFTTRDNGTGIGLSLSRNIMRMHQGSLSVKSVVGKMTCFTLLF